MTSLAAHGTFVERLRFNATDETAGYQTGWMGHRKTLARVDGVVAAGIHGVTNERGLETYHFPPREMAILHARAHVHRPIGDERIVYVLPAGGRLGNALSTYAACYALALRTNTTVAVPRRNGACVHLAWLPGCGVGTPGHGGLANPLPDEPSWWLNDVGATVSAIKAAAGPFKCTGYRQSARYFANDAVLAARVRDVFKEAAARVRPPTRSGLSTSCPPRAEQGHIRGAVPPPGRRVLGPDQRLRGLPPRRRSTRRRCGGSEQSTTVRSSTSRPRTTSGIAPAGALSGFRGAGNARRDRPPRPHGRAHGAGALRRGHVLLRHVLVVGRVLAGRTRALRRAAARRGALGETRPVRPSFAAVLLSTSSTLRLGTHTRAWTPVGSTASSRWGVTRSQSAVLQQRDLGHPARRRRGLRASSRVRAPASRDARCPGSFDFTAGVAVFALATAQDPGYVLAMRVLGFSLDSHFQTRRASRSSSTGGRRPRPRRAPRSSGAAGRPAPCPRSCPGAPRPLSGSGTGSSSCTGLSFVAFERVVYLDGDTLAVGSLAPSPCGERDQGSTHRRDAGHPRGPRGLLRRIIQHGRRGGAAGRGRVRPPRETPRGRRGRLRDCHVRARVLNAVYKDRWIKAPGDARRQPGDLDVQCQCQIHFF